ncbi:MAG: alanine racemase [Hadesarchaea archaeon]|nr:alanine racemase [Hadesarchaea archaeon]
MMDFIETAVRRNPILIKVATEFHQSGIIPANTVVIDLDVVKRNAEIIKSEADKFGVLNYFMTKQFGRNPLICNVIRDSGIDSAVAVDIEDVKCLHRHNIPVGHVGHLVQIPMHEVEYVLKEVNPEVITVFSVEKAEEISKVAERLGKIQKLLIRVVGKSDFFYQNQEGGFPEEKVVTVVKTINNLKGVKVVGVTSFPCLRLNLRSKKLEPLPNFDTLIRTASRLEKELGMVVEQINAPADTSAMVMKILAENGATHGEPGHGFTGTTPWHAFEDLPELPAWVYVSEVSHFLGDKAFAFGGGLMSADAPLGFWTYLYQKFRFYALVGREPETIVEKKMLAGPAGYIDYYGPLYPGPSDKIMVGDTVIYGLRNQIFVSRANVAVVGGIQLKKPKLLGIFDRTGNLSS